MYYIVKHIDKTALKIKLMSCTDIFHFLAMILMLYDTNIDGFIAVILMLYEKEISWNLEGTASIITIGMQR